MASPACCQAGNPVFSTYQPVGKSENINGMEVYTSGSAQSTTGVVLIYDIFGNKFPQVFEAADRIAAAGFQVAMPDVLLGEPWTHDKFPPKPEHDIRGWFSGAASYEKVSPGIKATVDLLKARGCTKLVIGGFCWGFYIATKAAFEPGFAGVVGYHPTTFGEDKKMAEQVTAPMCLLAADGDPLESLQEVLGSRSFGEQCVYKRFEGMVHGWCAARGDFSDPKVYAAAMEAHDMAITFFKSVTA